MNSTASPHNVSTTPARNPGDPDHDPQATSSPKLRVFNFSETRAILLDLSQVEDREPRWIWPGRIPRGHVSLVTGDPDVGKTLVLLSLAATVAEGEPWPDGQPNEGGRVIYIDGENGEHELKRRLVAQNFSAWDNFRMMSEVDQHGEPRPFSLSHHLAALGAAVRDFNPSWVVIDPLVAFHDRKENDATEVRALITDLARIAEAYDIGVTFLQHPNKSFLAPTNYRVRGSLDFVAAPRAVLRVELSEDQETRFLHVDKLNLGPKPPAIAFRIEGGWVEWLGPRNVVGAKSQKQLAREQLLSILGYGPIEANDLFEALEYEGISRRTVERAKKELGVISVKDGPDGPWRWELPATNGTAP